MHIGLLEFLRGHAQQNGGAHRRLGEEAVYVVLVDPLEAVRHTARRAAHACRQIHDQRMLLIHRDAGLRQLLVQPLCSHRVAQEQVDGLLVIHKVAHGVHVGQLAALRHSSGIVVAVLDDLHALAPEQILLPLLGVGGHVHLDLEAQRRAHDADGQAQIAGRADLHGVLAEEGLHVVVRQTGVVLIHGEFAALQRQILRMLEHLVDAAPGLDGARDGQMAVHLQEQPTGDLAAIRLLQLLLHGGDGLQGGFDQAVGLLGLREAAADEGGEPAQALLGVLDVRIGDDQLAGRVRHRKGQEIRIDPDGLFLVGNGPDDRIAVNVLLCVHTFYPFPSSSCSRAGMLQSENGAFS